MRIPMTVQTLLATPTKRLTLGFIAPRAALLLMSFGLMLTPLHSASAKEISWGSVYGKLSIQYRKDTCAVVFEPKGGKAKDLVSIPECDADVMTPPEPVKTAGKTTLPLKAATGDEFHLVAIPSARGGNACGGSDYYILVVREKDAWATQEVVGGCTELNDVSVAVKEKTAILTAKVKPSPDMEGTVYTVSFGKLAKQSIPKVVRTVKTTTNITVVGKLNMGGHFSNYLPLIELPKERSLIIHQAGKCNLDSLADSTVELMGEQKRFTDGSSEVTCLSVKPAQKKKH